MRILVHRGSRSELLDRLGDYGLGESHVDRLFCGCPGHMPYLRAWLDEREAMERSRDGPSAAGGGDDDNTPIP